MGALSSCAARGHDKCATFPPRHAYYTISRSTVLWRNIDVWRSFLQIAVHKYKGSSLKILYTIMIDNGGALRGMGVDGHEWEKMGIVVDMDKHST